MTLVTICIATYKRPAGLAALLASIDCQRLAESVDVEIVVVDNAPPTAQPVVEEFEASSGLPARYLQQPLRNIAITRNAGVAAASGAFIWFVDDDEVAEPNCLQGLLDAADQFNADVVYGPVIPSFEGPIADWLKPLHHRPIHRTGTISTARRTGNTLVRSGILAGIEGPFDEAFGLTGGEDSMMFRQLEARGLTLIDCEDAIAVETVPTERSTWKWIKDRRRRLGQIYGRQTVKLEGSLLHKQVALVSVKAAAQVFVWGIAALGTRNNRTTRSQYLLRMWTNLGKLEGIFNTKQQIA